jgi:hypothetical protein
MTQATLKTQTNEKKGKVIKGNKQQSVTEPCMPLYG